MKWISIKERLPDLDVDVLFTYDGKVEVGSYVWYDPGYRWVDRIVHLYRDEVTHWMPLPVPPITLPEEANHLTQSIEHIPDATKMVYRLPKTELEDT